MINNHDITKFWDIGIRYLSDSENLASTVFLLMGGQASVSKHRTSNMIP